MANGGGSSLLTLVEQPNVLLLDEPTNDLDLDTLRALEDLLDDWPGIAVVVSHDRAFLDRTVDEVWALDGAGGVRAVRGGVAGWLAEREAMADAARSKASTPSAGSTSSGGSAASATSAARHRASRWPVAARRPSGASWARSNGRYEPRPRLATDSRSRWPRWPIIASWLGSATSWQRLNTSSTPEERWLALAAEAEAIGLEL